MSDTQIHPARLRLRSFGSPSVEGPAGPLGGCAAQHQPLALLTLVAAAGARGLSRDRIVALLWPEADAGRASHRLSQLLHALRRCLGDDALTAVAGEIRLNPDRLTSDVADFKAGRAGGELEKAVACYTGPFMDGFFLDHAPEFERWVELERAGLFRAYGETLETLAIGAEARGDREAASRWWALLAEHEPLSSRVIMRLMAALAAHGDRAEALQQALRYEVGIGRELEAEPNPAVLALADRLRRAPAERASAAMEVKRFSLAVLPLVHLGPMERNDYMAEGLVEELTSRLTHMEEVRLVTLPSPEGVTRTGLDALLEGSIRQANGRIRLVLRLIDPADGSHLWSQRYDRAVEDVFELQDELAEEIVAELAGFLRRR
jgi:serine/threonine-protein kinase